MAVVLGRRRTAVRQISCSQFILSTPTQAPRSVISPPFCAPRMVALLGRGKYREQDIHTSFPSLSWIEMSGQSSAGGLDTIPRASFGGPPTAGRLGRRETSTPTLDPSVSLSAVQRPVRSSARTQSSYGAPTPGPP